MRWKIFSRIALALYVLALLWLLLFKLSFDVTTILLHFHTRTLNLVPFADYSQGMREMLDNATVFVPLGLLLGATFKRMSFWRKLLCMATLSVLVELLQFVCAIGVTDVTDVIMNTIGGFAGLALYRFGSKYIASDKLDRAIAVVTVIVLVMFVLFRTFVLKVKY